MKSSSFRVRAIVVAAAVPISLLFAKPAAADVKLPVVLSNSMVLQQGEPVPVWGWADKGEEVTVAFAGQTQKTMTGDDGKWSVKLTPLTASDKPAELTVTGKNKVALTDILVGEVWVCSGQSNMEFRLNSARDSAKEIAAADYPQIRLFTVQNSIKLTPQSDTHGAWAACSPKTAGDFSAVGYFFGRELHQKLHVPIGLIHTSWGGTIAEAWTPTEYLEKDAELAAGVDMWKKRDQAFDADKAKADYETAMEKWKPLAEAAKKEGKKVPNAPRMASAPNGDPNRTSVLYNGMVSPIIPFAMKGVIWYQGESNAGKAFKYRMLLPMMIQSWRDKWAAGGADKDFKFLIVNLANFQKPAEKPGDDDWAELREAQTMTAAMPNNGQALAIDLADANNPSDIHPKDKQDVGLRLALVALGKYYGKSDVVYSGPTFDAMKVEGDKAILTFKDADGIMAKGGEGKVTGFQIAGEDKKWFWADGKIEGATVVVSSPEVKKPAAVRYGWSHNPVANLYNAAGLPAVPFRTDSWQGVTEPKAK